ncbi:MATE family efflux transporter [Ruminococcus sp.]|uniref:MATE family efflux transporter n=1 Tax=Ruminococcus sp. TaxID=41978 RepID=UPI0025FE14D4|nr:MATE family efflux transporter [Ruminococcus sp.]
MNIKLSEHFGYKKLLKFTLPSIVMMIFTSIYGVVDGYFVSNFAGSTQFAAVNLIMPFLMIFGAVGFMIGTGGSALVSMKLGQKEDKKANEIFSLLIYVLIGVGIVFTISGIILVRPVASLLGAEGDMLDYCTTYGRIIMLALVPFMLQNVFQSFLVTAERPNLGLYITIAAGVTNMVLDGLFIGVFKWSIMGAATATALSQAIGGLIPLVYFILPNKTPLRLCKTHFDGKAILKACTNGASEFMTNISMSIVNMLYNFQLMKIAGENGVSAYGVIMYVNMFFVAIYLGYSIGTAPIVGYHYGADNTNELKGLFKKSLRIIGGAAIIITALAQILAPILSGLFVGYDDALYKMTENGFRIYAISFLLAGFNIYASSFFTALNNGFISALISFGRTLVFQILSVLILPLIFGLNGIWSSIIVAETLALVLSVTCFVKLRHRYHYA